MFLFLRHTGAHAPPTSYNNNFHCARLGQEWDATLGRSVGYWGVNDNIWKFPMRERVAQSISALVYAATSLFGRWRVTPRCAAWESDRRSINYARHQSITDTQMWIIILSSINLAAPAHLPALEEIFCENRNPACRMIDEIFDFQLTSIDWRLQ
jgi:hypothetical protein